VAVTGVAAWVSSNCCCCCCCCWMTSAGVLATTAAAAAAAAGEDAEGVWGNPFESLAGCLLAAAAVASNPPSPVLPRAGASPRRCLHRRASTSANTLVRMFSTLTGRVMCSFPGIGSCCASACVKLRSMAPTKLLYNPSCSQCAAVSPPWPSNTAAAQDVGGQFHAQAGGDPLTVCCAGVPE
jgi:hypothetical protein